MRKCASARPACRIACVGSAPAKRANEIATDYAATRHAFGKPLIDHEGVGFMLADNLIDLKQAELMIDWCADVLDTGVARHGRELDGQGGGVGSAVARGRSLRAGDGRHRRFAATRSSSRYFARSAPFASMTDRPKSINGRWPRRSSAIGGTATRECDGSCRQFGRHARSATRTASTRPRSHAGWQRTCEGFAGPARRSSSSRAASPTRPTS